MTNNYQNFNQQSIAQPGFAGTDPQQVRQNIQSVGQNQFIGSGNQQQSQQQFQQANFGPNQGQYLSPNTVFQPGFAGTNAQQVRQNINQSYTQGNQYVGGGYQQQQQQFQQQYRPVNVGANQFTGAQAVFQQGFAGTDAQQVRQNNFQSSQQQPQQQQMQQQLQQQMQQQPQYAQNRFQNQGFTGVNQYSGPQAIFQSGFSNTNPQQVRQDIANESNFRNQNQFGYQQ